MTDDLLEAQRIAKKAGKIRFAGVSTHYNMDQMLAYLVKLGQTDVVLTTYNFAMRNVAMDDNRRGRGHDRGYPGSAKSRHGDRRHED